jgi:hypothetical protein
MSDFDSPAEIPSLQSLACHMIAQHRIGSLHKLPDHLATMIKQACHHQAQTIQAAWRNLMRQRSDETEMIATKIGKHTIYIRRGDSYYNIEEDYAHVLWPEFVTNNCLYQDDPSIHFQKGQMQLYACEGELDKDYQDEWLCTISYEELKNIMGETRIRRILAESNGYESLHEVYGSGCSTEISELGRCFEGGWILNRPHTLQKFVDWVRENQSSAVL